MPEVKLAIAPNLLAERRPGLSSFRQLVSAPFETQEVIKYSELLGTPILSNLVIGAGSYQEGDGTIDFDGIELDYVIMTVSRNKRIVTSETVAGTGSIKEYINASDFSISIRGDLYSENVYPKEQTNILTNILKAPVALDVTAWYLNEMGIYSMVVENYSLPQDSSKLNAQPFELQCLSDAPLEIKLD